MRNFWDERYGNEVYAYGTEPNQFYQSEIKTLNPGKILFPAEGEGRNAVYAATLGWEVFAFDMSSEGKRKADLLASKNNVQLNYQIDGYESVNFPQNYFDCIVLIFAHIPPGKRSEYHQKLISFLKPGGTLIMESFSKEQMNYNSGGPRDIEMLYSVEDLKSDFKLLSELKINKTETNLSEGPFHQGTASVIRVTGKK